MLKDIIKYWEKNKNKLKNHFEVLNETDESYFSLTYNEIMELLLSIILEDNYTNLTELDYGHYQGTLIFIFTDKTYQPDVDQTYYTYVYYGSCSYCDTLERACESKEAVNDLLKLSLHLIQHIKVLSQGEVN